MRILLKLKAKDKIVDWFIRTMPDDEAVRVFEQLRHELSKHPEVKTDGSIS